MVVCLEQGADLHMAQLMPLQLTVFCFTKIQIDFTFWIPAHLGSPGKRAVKRVCVCVFCYMSASFLITRPFDSLLRGMLIWSVAMSTVEHKCSREAAFFHA